MTNYNFFFPEEEEEFDEEEDDDDEPVSAAQLMGHTEGKTLPTIKHFLFIYHIIFYV